MIAVQLQGHGRTADTDRPMTIETLAGDVVALLDHLGIDNADLFGFSLGGRVVLRRGRAEPQRVVHDRDRDRDGVRVGDLADP